MPPKQSRRHFDSTPEENATEAYVLPKSCLNEPDPNADAELIRLPYELIDEILDNYDAMPLDDHDGNKLPDPKCYERTGALTALSQTCKTLRNISLHRLWERLDICRVPKRSGGIWYKYTMSKPGAADALAALCKMPPKLPNLRMIHVINCKTPGFSKSLGDAKLKLLNVTKLLLPKRRAYSSAYAPTRFTYAASAAPTEIVHGPVDWSDLKLVDHLVKNAPNLRTLEIQPYTYHNIRGYGDWMRVISSLASLKSLSTLILSFPSTTEQPGDAASITAARLFLRKSVGERRLGIQRFLHRTLDNSTTETFE
ncbi:hypothetical protein DFH09DRAFT_1356584 [Mycena vulgaris]|nr:hypothetical protein DFH09DRAFT_1356584 [Mycena vulgaris]